MSKWAEAKVEYANALLRWEEIRVSLNGARALVLDWEEAERKAFTRLGQAQNRLFSAAKVEATQGAG